MNKKARKSRATNGGKARAKKLSKKRKREIAVNAATARWKSHNKTKEHVK